MFAERLECLPDMLEEFDVGWPIEDRAAWQAIDPDYKVRLLQTAEKMRGPWPSIPASAYLDFTRNGNRERFECLYFERRRMLCAFVVAECVADDGRYLDDIIDGIWLICEESGWQLPAHNTYVRDTPSLPLPDKERPVIDLFAAETGALLATILHLLGKRLDSASPMIRGRIQAELEMRIFSPYLSQHFWWMGNGDEPMCNWTAWCTQNILLCAFLIELPNNVRAEVIRKSAVSLDAFLKDYGEDGACEEGVLYYRHAALCLFNALNLLTIVAPKAFDPLWGEAKIRNMADFIMHMHVADDRFFNFADSSAKAGYCGAREYLFGRACGSPCLSNFALESWRLDPEPDLPQEINLFYRLQTAQTIGALGKASQSASIPDHFYPSIGLLTARDERYALAVKAGHNGESHNHNDAGSFTLYRDGAPVLIDVGVETYSAKTFSDRRYEIWTMQSAFHNLPSFEKVQQGAGVGFAASDVVVSIDETVAELSMDIASAYPPEAEVEQYRRTVRLNKGVGVEVIDHFVGLKTPVLSLMCAEKPILQSNEIILQDGARILLEGYEQPQVEAIEITDERLQAAWPGTLYRLLVPLVGKKVRLFVQ